MNTKLTYLTLTVIAFAFCVPKAAAAEENIDLTEPMKKSLVYLNISSYEYETMQPWKRKDISQRSGYGCAVGPYEVLTTAWNISDATFIKARRHGQNEFIGVTVKVIDYQVNLCLLELDKSGTDSPFVPIVFSEDYEKGAAMQSYWLSSGGHLTMGRGYMDRAEVGRSTVSFTRGLNYVAANAPNASGRGRLFCTGEKPAGIVCWADGDNQEAGLIPAETINRFLADAKNSDYKGAGVAGFAVRTLIDPARRQGLKMPSELKHGVYVSKVYTLGTGCDVLKKGDVILAIDGESINPYGRYLHPDFDRISYHHLISGRYAGDEIVFDVWRDGKQEQLKAKVKNFEADDMLVPYHEYDVQPEYLVTAGFVLQKLARSYLSMWGDGWPGKVPPHLYHYYRDKAFAPTDDRQDIVILSFVLPGDINLGYQQLGRIVVSKFNGMEIKRMSDILAAKKLNPESKYDVIEFEHDYPTVVIDREQAKVADARMAQLYGITQFVHIEQ